MAKTINVVAAIIQGVGENKNKIFATQRGCGDFKDGWEFPGGKVEEGETPEDALIREISEELDTVISVNEYLYTVEYDYPQFHLSMKCYLCTVTDGKLILKEHEASKWLTKNELYSVDWLPADQDIIPIIEQKMKD
jgi:8-oxo-dGTP diphosphatase